MYVRKIYEALAERQVSGSGRVILDSVARLPYGTKGERLRLAMDVLRFGACMQIELMQDLESFPDFKKLPNLVSEAISYAHNPTIVKGKLFEIALICLFEPKLDSFDTVDAELVTVFLDGECTYEEFVGSSQRKTDKSRFPYSVTGISGRTYAGNGVKDMAKLNMEEITDMLDSIEVSESLEGVREWIDANEDEIKKRFKSKRIAYMALLKSSLYPDGDYPTVAYVKEKMQS